MQATRKSKHTSRPGDESGLGYYVTHPRRSQHQEISCCMISAATCQYVHVTKCFTPCVHENINTVAKRAYNCHGNQENAVLQGNTASYRPRIDQSDCNMTSSHIINYIKSFFLYHTVGNLRNFLSSIAGT